MTAWTGEELDRIGTAQELDVASLRPDGTPRKPVTIWVIREGDDLYVRSWRGESARDRLTAVRDLQDRGAAAVVGDLSDLEETRGVADQLNRLGRTDAVIHRPRRLVYLSSSMHRGGRASLTGMDWRGHRATGSYSDSKLFVSTHAVDARSIA